MAGLAFLVSSSNGCPTAECIKLGLDVGSEASFFGHRRCDRVGVIVAIDCEGRVNR